MLFENTSVSLLLLGVTITTIYLLWKWSKELENRRFTIFLYFLISTYIAPLYSRSTEDGIFQVWFPLGFALVFIYLFVNKKNHPGKIKASLLGLTFAAYKLINEYIELFY